MVNVVVIVFAVALVVASAVVLLRQGSPEDTASHDDEPTDDTDSDRFYRGVDRPAGPDADSGTIRESD